MITVSSSTSAAELQAIVDAAPAGETIVLGAGTFSFDRTVVIDRDDIAITGTGSGVTTIQLVGNARAGGAFQIGGPIDEPVYTAQFELSQGASEGAMYLHLADATGLMAGDHLWIELANTDAYLDSIGDQTWREDKPLRTSMVEVASVQGNTVRLTNGLAFDFSEIASVQRIEVAENVRLGGFTVDSGLAVADPGRFENVEASFDRANVIALSGTSHVKLFDISVENAPSNGFTFAQSLYLETSNLTVEGAVNKGDGGNGYAFQLRALYDSDLAGIEAYDTRHALLFASWTSEVNNSISVRATNRDINFHGGPDHDNVVEVLSSERTETEAGYMSPALFVNSTAPAMVRRPILGSTPSLSARSPGTNKVDLLIADDHGVEFHARAGADIIIGGRGNDQLYADKGDDVIYASGGRDSIDGGLGRDTVIYDGDRSEFTLSKDLSGHLVIHKAGGYDIVGGVEALRFDDGTVSVATLVDLPRTYFGSDDADRIEIASSHDIVLSGGGFDRIVSAVSYTLGVDNEALELTGTAAANGFGNALANTFAGNDAANDLFGFAGADRFFARGGNDYLSGGDGDDELYGPANDGGCSRCDGEDLLNGRRRGYLRAFGRT